MKGDDTRKLTLRAAAQVLGVNHSTAWRMFRKTAKWGRHRGQRCLVVTLRQVRAAALPHVEGSSTEARIAKLEAELGRLIRVLDEEAEPTA